MLIINKHFNFCCFRAVKAVKVSAILAVLTISANYAKDI